MNLDNIPNQFKQLFKNRNLTMNQKMVTFMAFMPDVPGMLKMDDHLELGMKIKHLIGEGKIRLDGFDKDFKIKVSHC